MKKNQNGVSMVSLVITIIVIIILAAVAFSGSQETIGRAGFSGFATDIDSVRTAFVTEGVTALMGEQTQDSKSVNNAQAFNYLAKGASTDLVAPGNKDMAWLTKGEAEKIPCTRIEPEWAKEAIGIELPEREVNTYNATNVPMSYFVTNKGDIFVWPPYERSDEGLFYVNDQIPVQISGEALPLSGDREAEMYDGDFKFVVNGVEIHVKNDALIEAEKTITADMVGVYYDDTVADPIAYGIESKRIQTTDTTTKIINGACKDATVTGA